jgi:hypothetical protein
MENYLSTYLTCPSCGNDHFDPETQCICGYSADEHFMTQALTNKNRSLDMDKIKTKAPAHPVDLKKAVTSKKNVIKEVDSWVFSFSEQERCICLSTPALQSFRLNLTVDDLEELLEVMYRKTGREMTTRKLRLPYEEISDVIEHVTRLIEEKKSKVILDFSDEELEGISGMINDKLKK